MTDLQKRTLAKFAAGETAHRCTHTNINTNDSHFFHNGRVTIRVTTIRALLKDGLIEDFEDPKWRWRVSRYRITEKGKSMASEATL